MRSPLYGNHSLLCFTDYRKRITSGETTLKELASTESDCSSARKEGDLGFFGPGQMQSKNTIFLSYNFNVFSPLMKLLRLHMVGHKHFTRENLLLLSCI